MAWQPGLDGDSRADSGPPAEHANMREVDLDAVVRRQTPARTRLIQVGVLLTVLIVIGGLVSRGYWAGQPHPPAAAVDDVTMNAAIFSNVNYGTLAVNGKKLDAHPPVIVTLRAGPNTISISAPPFRPHTCIFDMTRQRIAGGQCTAGSSGIPQTTIGGKHAATWIHVPMDITGLPVEQQHSVATIVAQVLDGIVVHTTVPAHQYIGTGVDAHGQIVSRLTDEDLQAEATLVGPTALASHQDFTCVEHVCPVLTVPNDLSDLSGTSGTTDTQWKVATVVWPHWRFTTRAGNIAAASSINDASGTEVDMPLHYDVAHGWRLWGSPEWRQWDSPAFASASGSLDVIANVQRNAGIETVVVSVLPTNEEHVSTFCNGIEGCELQLLNSSGTSTASFIWRFGVLLAADAGAHKMVPGLPVAPQAEIDAVTKQA